MPNALPHRRVTDRDLELFEALDRHPFTTDQLLRLSAAFRFPFTQDRLLRRRLQQLREDGMVRCWPLATARLGGSPLYWKLTRQGFLTLAGENASIPARRYFDAIAPGHHHHTQSLGAFLVHTFVAAQRQGIAFRHFVRENSLSIRSDVTTLFPDCAFQLQGSDGRIYHFCVELDNGTERVRSALDTESIERKIRGYDAHQAQFAATDAHRYLVLFVTTRSSVRLKHILDVAALVTRNPQRTVFVGVSLDAYLRCADPFREAILTDHRGLRRTLIPSPGLRMSASLTRPLKVGNVSRFPISP